MWHSKKKVCLQGRAQALPTPGRGAGCWVRGTGAQPTHGPLGAWAEGRPRHLHRLLRAPSAGGCAEKGPKVGRCLSGIERRHTGKREEAPPGGKAPAGGRGRPGNALHDWLLLLGNDAFFRKDAESCAPLTGA